MHLWRFRGQERRLGLTREGLREAEVSPGLVLSTLTNQGYLPYTRNLLASLAPLGLRERILVFCTDDRSAAELRDEGARTVALPLADPIEDLQLFRRGSFRDVVRQKLVLVSELLGLGLEVLFSDGDVVFLRDPVQDLRSRLGRAEILMQNDDRHDSRRTDPARIELCTGFFLVRPTRATRRVFDPRRLSERFRDDQHYFNASKRGLRIAVLDRSLYPNGSWFLDHPAADPERSKRQAYVVHMNHRIGREKQAQLRRHGLWWEGSPAAKAGSATALRPQQPQPTP